MDMEYLLWLQTIRNDFLDTVLVSITDLVVSPAIYVIIAIVYWCFNKRAALFLAMNIGVGSMVNQTLKNIFCVYRPWIKNPQIVPVKAALENATGYSFPSGHTQIATSGFLSIAVWQKKRKWLVALCVFLIVLVMFTRNYLGVHTLSDVIVSFFVASLIVFLNGRILAWVDKGKNRDIIVSTAGVITSLVLLIYLTLKAYPIDYNPDGSLMVNPQHMIDDCYVACGCVTGFFTGWILERRFVNFNTDITPQKRVLRAITGALIMLLYMWLLREPLAAFNATWGEFIFFSLAFILILYGYPAIFTKIKNMSVK